VCKKFPITARSSYKKAKVALQGRFKPESRRDLYLAEFQTRRKGKTETWPEFGEDLMTLVDKAYPSLDYAARQQQALQRYLSQLKNEQVAFNVKQRKPKSIEAAVSTTLECESRSYSSDTAIAPVQVESKRDDALVEMMTQLMARMDRLEGNSKHAHPKQDSTVTDQVKSSGMLPLWSRRGFCKRVYPS